MRTMCEVCGWENGEHGIGCPKGAPSACPICGWKSGKHSPWCFNRFAPTYPTHPPNVWYCTQVKPK